MRNSDIEIDIEIIIENFKKNGFKIEEQYFDTTAYRPDLIVSIQNQKYVVEIKKKIVSTNQLVSVIFHLIRYQILFNAKGSILVTIIRPSEGFLKIIEEMGVGLIYSPNEEVFETISQSSVGLPLEEIILSFNKINSYIKSNIKETETKKQILSLLSNFQDKLAFFSLFQKRVSASIAAERPADRILISQNLIDEINSIPDFTYYNEINGFIRKLDEKDSLLDITMETLKELWTKHKKGDIYIMFENYKEFEPILFKNLYYRDHFLHQFQVFLLGCTILNKHMNTFISNFKKNIEGNYNRDNIFFTWLLASTFHDIGYPVQQFPDWINSFFTQFINVKNLPLTADFSCMLSGKNYLEYIDKICSLYCHLNTKSDQKWKYSDYNQIDNNVRKFILKKLLEKRNHGIISGLCLLDIIENGEYAKSMPTYRDNVFSPYIIPASMAIILHDNDVYASGKIKKIKFNDNPLSFLLIFCDTVQEWGRPNKLEFKKGENYDPILTNLNISKNEIVAELTYTIDNEYNSSAYRRKRKEIEIVFDRIKSSKPIFSIKIKYPGKSPIEHYSG